MGVEVEVEWRDPAPRTSVPPRNGLTWQPKHWEYTAIARSKPGEWLVLPLDPPLTGRPLAQKADNIRRGRLAAFRPVGHWESAARGSDLFIRYVGPVDADMRPETSG